MPHPVGDEGRLGTASLGCPRARPSCALSSWTEDTRAQIFSESPSGPGFLETQCEELEKKIEGKLQEFEELAAAGQQLVAEEHYLSATVSGGEPGRVARGPGAAGVLAGATQHLRAPRSRSAWRSCRACWAGCWCAGERRGTSGMRGGTPRAPGEHPLPAR